MFLLWEEEQLGVGVKDLSGRTILTSELDWLNRYLCQGEVSSTGLYLESNLSLEQVESARWHDFPSYIYQQLDKSQLSKICQVALEFFDWVAKIEPALSSVCQMAKGALNVGKKDMERLIKIYKYFADRQKTWIYIPGPTESLDAIQWNEQLMALQKPDEVRLLQDTFELVSKNLDQLLGYFKGLGDGQPVVVQLDSRLCQLLQSGDRLPLTLSQSFGGHYFLEQVGYPLQPSSAWTK
jgi:hypothetical protein